MTARSDLIERANALKQQAESEPDATIRDRLARMAERYNHLAESQSWSEAHPPTAAALGEMLTKRD
jgi:hypothetical protein